MTTQQLTQINDAIREVFISPNVSDSNGEAANVVDAMANVANGLFRIAKAIDGLADVQRELQFPESQQERRQRLLAGLRCKRRGRR